MRTLAVIAFAPVFEHDAADVDLRLEGSASGDEGFHQAARQIERTALTELIARLEIEGANDRAGGARLRHGVGEPGAEQRHLEQEQQLDVFVLEQLFHHVERLALADRQKIAPDVGLRQKRLALGKRQGLGVALGDQNARGDFLGALVPLAEGSRVLRREARHVGDGFLAVAPEHERRTVAVRLPEFITRRDIGDAILEPEIAKPRRLGNAEMIDGMKVVIEARQGGFLGHQAAAIVQPAIDDENFQAGAREITPQHEALMTRADDDPVIGFFKGPAHASSRQLFDRALNLASAAGRRKQARRLEFANVRP